MSWHYTRSSPLVDTAHGASLFNLAIGPWGRLWVLLFMALFDKNTWYILQHLHHSVAAAAAAQVDAGEEVVPMAYLLSPSAAHDGPACMNVAEVSAEFMAQLSALPHGQQLLNKYLTDALREGSLAQQQIALEYAVQASYTVSVQETLLPQADNQTQARPALMVLLRGHNFSLPIFHLIEAVPGGRRCHVRSFPDMHEIEAVQHMLQVRSPQRHILH